MHLAHVEMANVRCIAQACLELHPQLNLICGPNGSGKTSFLEAIHLLALGRSFRTRHTAELVRHGETHLTIAARMISDEGISTPIGVKRAGSSLAIHYGGQPIQVASILARKVPLVVFGPDSHVLLGGGPRERRRLLDRTLFHVKQSYLGDWTRYHRALRQRNVLLRKGARREECRPWESDMAVSAHALDTARSSCVTELAALLESLADALGLEGLTITYDAGWDSASPLDDEFDRRWTHDRTTGMTNAGPHRADLRIQLGGRDASRTASRGQAKLLLAALVLAQAALIRQKSGLAPILLVDDLAAELDNQAKQKFIQQLSSSGSQLLITAADPSALPTLPDAAMFHVKHGTFDSYPAAGGGASAARKDKLWTP
jgi:DNA replication and repair protein RecF